MLNNNLNGRFFSKEISTWGWIVLVLIMLVVATYLRIVTAQETDVMSPIRADARQYYNYANNLKNQGVYSIQDFERTGWPVPDAQRNPGYPLFLLPFVERPHHTFDAIHTAGTPLPRYAIPLRPLIFGLGVLGGVLGYRVLKQNIPRPNKDQ